MSELKTPPIAARLRASVLQQAIQGRLVPQDPTDEPARDLMKDIYLGSDGSWYEQQSKGKVVCIDDDIPFDLPDTWCWARMSSLCAFGSCVNIEYSDVPVDTWNLDLEDLEKDTGRILQKKRKGEKDTGSTKHVFKTGMVLYSKLRPYLNKVTVADEDGVCTSEILPLSFDYMSSEFAARFFMSPYFLDFANRHTSGIKMPRLRVADTKGVLVPVPPLAEQHRIVERIDEIMPLIDQLEIKERESDSVDSAFWRMLPQSILQWAVEGRLVPQDPADEPVSGLLKRIREERAELVKQKKAKAPKGGESRIFQGADGSWYEQRGKSAPVCIDEEIPFDIPESWEWARLSTFFSKLGSGSTPTGGRKVYRSEGPILIRSQNVHNEGLRLDDVARFERALFEKRNSHVFGGDLLLNITGASIGRCAITPDDLEDADVNQHVLVMRPIEKCLSSYLHLAIITPLVFGEIMACQVGSTKEGLSATRAANLILPVPPLEEQQRIVAKVNGIFGFLKKAVA